MYISLLFSPLIPGLYSKFREYFLKTEGALNDALTAIARLQAIAEDQQREIDVLRRHIRNHADSMHHFQKDHRNSPYRGSAPRFSYESDPEHDYSVSGENPMKEVKLSMNSI